MIYSLRVVIEQVLQLGFVQELENFLICSLSFWIKVESKSSSEHRGVLRDHGDSGSKVLKFYLSNVDTVNKDLPFKDFDNSADSKAYSTLASTSSADHTNLLSALDLKAKISEHSFSIRSVLKGYVLKLHRSSFRPLVSSSEQG